MMYLCHLVVSKLVIIVELVMIDMTKFTVVRYGDGTNGRDNLGMPVT